MSDQDRRAPGKGQPQDSEFAAEVAHFLNVTNHPELRLNRDEAWDCLWQVLPPDEAEQQVDTPRRPDLWPDPDTLQHELARASAGTSESRPLEVALLSMRPAHHRLQEALVELLTGRCFPSQGEFGREPEMLARRLYDTLQRHFLEAGESAEHARLHATAALKAMARSPERYRKIVQEAGLSELDDSGMAVSPDSPVAGPRAPHEPQQATCLPSGTAPLITDDLYLDPDEAPDEPGHLWNPAERSPSHPAALPGDTTGLRGRPGAVRDEEKDPDEWFFRGFLLGDENKWYGRPG